MLSINEVLSKKLQVEPLKEGEIREFVLCRAGVYNPNLGKPTTPQGHGLPGKAMIRDPFDKNVTQDKLILNIVGHNPIMKPGEKTTFDPIIESIFFPSTGRIICTSETQGQYAFLKRHPKNRDNPYRKLSVEPVFYEVDDTRDAIIEKHKFMYRTLAANILLGLDLTQMLGIAIKVNRDPVIGITIDLNKNEDQILSALTGLVEKTPRKFIELSEDEFANTRVIIDDLIDEERIVFDDKKREFFWSDNKKNICKIEKGNRPLEGFCDYLISAEGSKDLALVKAAHSNIYLDVVG